MTKTKDDIESDFYFYARMAGLNQIAPNKFTFDGTTYTAHASVDEAVAKAFGGKAKAFKLIRHASLIQLLASKPNGAHIAGIVSKSFDLVSQRYPILRSYYEGTQVGGFHHAWMRWQN